MSSESDGQSQSGNIDTIKELLRKLEEVAVRDPVGEEQIAEPIALIGGPAGDAASKSEALLALRRGTSLMATGEASTARPIVIDTTPTSFATPVPAGTVGYSAERSGNKRGIAIAAGSFVLGVAAAGVLILAFQPVSQLLRGPGSEPGAAVAVATKPQPQGTAQPRSQSVTTSEVARSEPAPAAATASTGSPDANPAAIVKPAEPARIGETSEPSVIAAPAPVQVRSPAQQPPSSAIERVADTQYRIEIPDRVELRAGERRTVDIRLTPSVSEATRLLVVLRNVPAWLSLSKGGAVGKEIWLLPAHQSTDVALEAAEGANGNVEIKVQLASIDGRIVAERTIAVRAIGLPASNAPMVASAPAANDQMIQRLQARGELLLDTGEVEAARTLFRTAAEAGSVTAALRLAETYDPGEIQRFGMMETAADPVMAVRWYEHAQALGSPVATARLATLARR